MASRGVALVLLVALVTLVSSRSFRWFGHGMVTGGIVVGWW
ncbi:hypothetical protein ACXZ9C_11000 [Streptococcus agalactiae]